MAVCLEFKKPESVLQNGLYQLEVQVKMSCRRVKKCSSRAVNLIACFARYTTKVVVKPMLITIVSRTSAG